MNTTAARPTAEPRLLPAVIGCATALAVAAAVNLVLLALAGETLAIPGEMSVLHVAGFTLAMTPFAAGALRLWPRYFPYVVVVAVALAAPFPVLEFGAAAGAWLNAMHVVAGVAAVVLGPRVAGRLQGPGSA